MVPRHQTGSSRKLAEGKKKKRSCISLNIVINNHSDAMTGTIRVTRRARLHQERQEQPSGRARRGSRSPQPPLRGGHDGAPGRGHRGERRPPINRGERRGPEAPRTAGPGRGMRAGGPGGGCPRGLPVSPRRGAAPPRPGGDPRPRGRCRFKRAGSAAAAAPDGGAGEEGGGGGKAAGAAGAAPL